MKERFYDMGTGAGREPIAAAPVPAGWRVRADPELRLLEEGTVLLGGVPLRLFRLGPRAAAHVRSWLDGAPVADRPRARALARRLLDAGAVHPAPLAAPAGAVTVVVPVRDRAGELGRCLAALGRGHRVVVVDDGSRDPAAVAAAAGAASATVVRRERNGGPAAARNTGLRVVRTPFVAFLDSDCLPSPGWIDGLLPHLADPAVAIVAPRIVGAGVAGRHGLAAFEHERSALDLGPLAAAARPRSRVPYVPAAALLARVDALGDGFDESMRVGEDVDLVWRLAAAGWTIRYEPGVEVPHVHRARLGPWLATRIAYNEATGVLARRHPGALHAAYASRGSLLAWGAAAAGHPGLAVALVGASGMLLRRRLAPFLAEPAGPAARITAGAALRDGLDLAGAVRGPWLPFALAASARSRRARRATATALLLAPLVDHALARSAVDPLTGIACRALADVARGVGVWRGCLRHGVAAPLLPAIGAGPAGAVGTNG